MTTPNRFSTTLFNLVYKVDPLYTTLPTLVYKADTLYTTLSTLRRKVNTLHLTLFNLIYKEYKPVPMMNRDTKQQYDEKS